MKAAVLYGFGEPVKVEDVELAPPKDNEVKVKIVATGVCHSDLSVKDGKLPLPPPLILGHEAAGIVQEVGPGVGKVKEGDHVIVNWIPYCGDCWFCAHDEPIHCLVASSRYGMMRDGTTRLAIGDTSISHGIAATFAEEAVLHENGVVKIDDDVPLEVAALVGCGVTTGVGAVINTTKVPKGARVAVVGCGGVGINVIQGARIAGASKIIAVDVVPSKLEQAKKFGATDTVNAKEGSPAQAVQDLTDGVGADFVFEVIGNVNTIQQSIDMTRRGGYTVLVGVAPFSDQLSINPAIQTLSGRSIIGCYFGSTIPERDFPKMIQFWRDGKLDLEGLISARGGIEDINSAFEAMEQGNVLRTVIAP